jgi:hypothetical protein
MKYVCTALALTIALALAFAFAFAFALRILTEKGLNSDRGHFVDYLISFRKFAQKQASYDNKLEEHLRKGEWIRGVVPLNHNCAMTVNNENNEFPIAYTREALFNYSS